MSNIQHGKKRPRFPNKWLVITGVALGVGLFWLGFYLGSVMEVTL